jgi:hypothetical protein
VSNDDHETNALSATTHDGDAGEHQEAKTFLKLAGKWLLRATRLSDAAPFIVQSMPILAILRCTTNSVCW